MAKSDKKSKDTIVISKRSLFLVIFLAIIAIVVAIAVPATIHLKEKRKESGGSGGADYIEKQIGEDGFFFARLIEDDYYGAEPVEDEDEDEDENDGEIFINAVPECINVDENGVVEGETAVTDCYTPPYQKRYRTVNTIYGTEEEFQAKVIDNVAEFVEIFGYEEDRYDDEFFYKHKIVSIVATIYDCGGEVTRVFLSGYKGTEAKAVIEYESSCSPCGPESSIYFIILDSDENIKTVTEPEYKDKAVKYCGGDIVEKKPVIYLYPTKETDVDVELGAPEKLTVSYPKYDTAWKVTASPDGKLVDRTTGRKLYSLYYETDYTSSKGIREEGFVVKGADSAKFLEEKLAQLGLNEYEAEEFIVYWLPQLEKNAYNYIYFAPAAEIAENMPFNVSPAPATVIRINMEFKALDAPIQVKEQQLPETPVRQGFTLVEWGGTIL